MSRLFIRQIGVVLALVGVGVLGLASAAGADPGTGSASAGSRASVVVVAETQSKIEARLGRPLTADEKAVLLWDITFDRVLTAGLWQASGVSAAAMAAYCTLAVPGFARPACLYIANSSLFGAFRRLGPPNGRCLNISPRLGIPPYRLSYVSCP